MTVQPGRPSVGVDVTPAAARNERAARDGTSSGVAGAVGDGAPSGVERAEALARSAAVAWLLVLACLALWSLGPVALGWRPTVVVSGSMRPTIRPGDVVVVDPDLSRLRAGQIVLARDPSMPSGRVAHRVVTVQENGNLVTKGDANPTADVGERQVADVIGTVRLVVPAAGRLALLRRQPSRGDLAWAATAVAACLTLGLTRRPPGWPDRLARPPGRS